MKKNKFSATDELKDAMGFIENAKEKIKVGSIEMTQGEVVPGAEKTIVSNVTQNVPKYTPTPTKQTVDPFDLTKSVQKKSMSIESVGSTTHKYTPRTKESAMAEKVRQTVNEPHLGEVSEGAKGTIDGMIRSVSTVMPFAGT